MFATRSQNKIWDVKRNVKLRCFDVCSIGINIRIKMDIKSAITPPSLLGIDRKIA